MFYAACQEYSTAYFKRMELSTTYQWPTSYVLEMKQCSSCKQGGDVVQNIPFVDADRDDDARSCPGTTVYASGVHPNRSHS